MKQLFLPFAVLILAAMLVLAGRGPAPASAGPSSAPLKVVATTSHLADAAAVLGGDAVQVTALMGPGVDPHLYKPTPKDLAALQGAGLVLVHGLELEGRMGEVVSSLASGGREVFTAGDHAPQDRLILAAGAIAKPDPHIWNDPKLWSDVVRALGSRMSKLAAEDKRPAIDARTAEAAKVIAGLAEDLSKEAEKIPKEGRVLVTAHDAFAYFGRSFGFEVHAIQGISTASEAGAQEIVKLADLVADRKVKAVFLESSVPRATVEALVKAVESRGHSVAIGGTLYSDSLGPQGSGADTYTGMMKSNMRTVVEALQ